MAFFDNLSGWFRRESRNLENPSYSLTNPNSFLVHIFGNPTSSGRNVGFEQALAVSAVWACWRLISETVASLSLEVLERDGEDRVKAAREHSYYKLLHDEPSPRYTSMLWIESIMLDALAFGTGYSLIKRDKSGRAIELIHVPAQKVKVEIDTQAGEPVYKIKDIDKVYRLTDFIVIPVMAFNGMTGTSVIHAARELLAEALAANEFSSNYFNNGAALGGVIHYDGTLTSETRETLLNSWTKKFLGSSNRGKVPILENGMKFSPMTNSAQEADVLQLRKFYNEEVSRFYGIPSPMIGALDNATLNNVEHLSINFVRYCLRPYLKKWEQELNRKLFITDGERKRYFTKFNLNSLLRGDTEARGAFYQQLWQVGAMSPNDIRKEENLNPIDGGDNYFRPLNYENLNLKKEETNE